MQIKKTKSHVYCIKVEQRQKQGDIQTPQRPDLSSQNEDLHLDSFIWNQSISQGSGLASKQTQKGFILKQEDNVNPVHEFIDTENEMIQIRKKDHFRFMNPQIQTVSTRTIRLLKTFSSKLNSLRRKYSYMTPPFEEQVLKDNGNGCINNAMKIYEILQIIYPVFLLLALTVFSLCLAFEEIFLTQLFLSVCILFLTFTIIKIPLTLLYNNRFKNKQGLVISLSNFILSCLLLFFHSKDQREVLPYLTSAMILSLLWSFSDEIKGAIFQLVAKFKFYTMLRYTSYLYQLFKFALWVHAISISLAILIRNNQEINWMNSLSSQREAKSTIYIRSFFEALSITLSAGIHFPTPMNTTQLYYFLLIRVVIVVVSARTLYLLFWKIKKLLLQKQEFNASTIPDQYAQSYCTDTIKYLSIEQLSSQEQRKIIQIKPIFTGSLFIFNGLSSRVYCELAKKCSSSIITKDSILSSFNKTYDWLILGKGRMKTISRTGTKIYEITSQFDTKISNTSLLMNSSFLRKRFPGYRLISQSTSLIYRIKDEDFRKVLKISEFDHQLMLSQRDKYSFTPSQFEVIKCSYCKKKHSQFECPSVHYLPFASLIVTKYLSLLKQQRRRTFQVDYQIIPRIRSSALKYHIHMSEIAENIKKELKLNETKLKHPTTVYFSQIKEGGKNIPTLRQYEVRRIQIGKADEEDDVWLIHLDKLHDFLYYFPKNNPEALNLKTQSQ